MATCLLIMVLASVGWAGESLTEEQQMQIIEDYMLVTRQHQPDLSAAADSHGDSLHPPTLKCGTPAILRFVTNYDRLDQGLLKSLGVQLIGRDTLLTDSVDSPRGRFRVHYTTLGADALYGGAETAAQIASIMDSVYTYIVDTLDYPAPPRDGYEPGGDEKYDIYMKNLGSMFYGMTYADSLGFGDPQKATSFIELNADPRRLHGYNNDPHSPMDAIRVTAAHEFFHAVQFGIDWGEAEDIGTEYDERRYWMEMSAVWMEEEIYDDINDYYYYLEHFFNVPEYSIQRFQGLLDLHPYGSVVFPIYLSERFGRDIIRDIWLLCGELGFGPSFLRAADSAIWETSNHTQDWVSVFSEFALWNYLTGERADLTVWDGYNSDLISGYSEKEAYPAIPFEKLHAHYKYPTTVVSNLNLRESPRHNGAYYLSLHLLETANIMPDTTLWVCDTGAGEFPNCTDSIQVGDTLGWGDPWYSYAVHVDTTIFNISLALGNLSPPMLPGPWGVNIIYQLEEAPDSLIVERYYADDDASYQIKLPDHAEYRSLTFILTPASTNRAFYEVPQYRIMWVGYGINESNYDSLLVEVPGAVLDPYPNPAVVEQMDRPRVTFRLRVPTDGASYPMGLPFVAQDTYLQIDVYTIAGERIKTVIANDRQDERTGTQQREGEFQAEWDLTNESGADVAAGVYLVYARLFSNAKRGVLLAEDHTKLLIVR